MPQLRDDKRTEARAETLAEGEDASESRDWTYVSRPTVFYSTSSATKASGLLRRGLQRLNHRVVGQLRLQVRVVQVRVGFAGEDHGHPGVSVADSLPSIGEGVSTDRTVVGDRPNTDIAGAVAIGARSVWVGRGQKWVEAEFAPTLIADTAAEAIRLIVVADTRLP